MALENQLERIASALETLCEKLMHVGTAVAPMKSTPAAELKEPLHKQEGQQDAAETVATGIELDDDELPWDARIHSSGKTKVKAGTWTPKRGVDPAYKAEIENELRLSMAAKPPEVQTTTQAPTPPQAPKAPKAPKAPEPPSPGLGSDGPGDSLTFPQFQARVGEIAQQLGPRAVELAGILAVNYGVSLVSELKPEQYQGFLETAEAL